MWNQSLHSQGVEIFQRNNPSTHLLWGSARGGVDLILIFRLFQDKILLSSFNSIFNSKKTTLGFHYIKKIFIFDTDTAQVTFTELNWKK